jgi:hypothetical protein
MPAYGIALIVATWLILSRLVAGLALKWGREPASWFSLSVVASPLIASVALFVKGKGRMETREHKRMEVQLKGEGTLNIEGKECPLELVATNISASGAYCLADSPPGIGGKMKLHLQWSPEVRQSELVLKAVKTIIRVDPQPEGNYGFAVKFNVPLLSIR